MLVHVILNLMQMKATLTRTIRLYRMYYLTTLEQLLMKVLQQMLSDSANNIITFSDMENRCGNG